MSGGVEHVYVGATLAPGGDRVVDAAAALSDALGAKLHLVHVLPPNAEPACREERERRLQARAGRLGAAKGVQCELRTAADTAEALLSSDAGPGSTLVVGAHESDGVLGKRLGGTCEAILRRASCPLLVVRGSWALRSGAEPADGGGGRASELEERCRDLQSALVVLPLPPARGPVGRWRRWRSRRLVGRLESSVLLLPA